MEANEARLNITYGGDNGDLVDPVFFDAVDGDIRTWATEAVVNGSIPGITANADADFTDFQVDRYPANEEQPNRIFLRPKTPFGASR